MFRDIRRTGEASVRDATADLPPSRKGAARVSLDMERIFGSTSSIVPIDKPRGHDAVIPIVGNDSASRHRWLIGGIVVAFLGLFVAGGAAWLGLTSQGPRPTMAPATIVAPVKGATTQIKTAPLTAAPASQSMTPTPAAAAAQSTPHTVVPARKVASAASSSRARRSEDRRRGFRTAQLGAAIECSSTREKRVRASCMYPDILAADKELRIAYARASASGVSVRLLRQFRDRWWQVRRDVASDPDYATEAYRQLARELDIARGNG